METLHGQGCSTESSESAASTGWRPLGILSPHVWAGQPVRAAIPPSPVLLLSICRTKLCPQVMENVRCCHRLRSSHGSQYQKWKPYQCSFEGDSVSYVVGVI
jgi:hypothetical protein